MEASIRKVTKDVVTLEIGVDELRVLLHRLAPSKSTAKSRAEALLPENSDAIANELWDILQRIHDNSNLER